MTTSTAQQQQTHSTNTKSDFKLSEFLDSVISRLSVEDVYSHPSHQLKVSGNRHRGGCPFHESKSGSSFVVSRDSLLFWCEGCQHGGSALDYLYSLKVGYWDRPRGRDFVETVKQLGELAEMPLPEFERSPEAIEKARQWESRRAILQAVIEHSQQVLWSSRGEDARRYLIQERGLTEDQIRDLGLGLYLSREDVERFLRKNDFSLEDAKNAGVIWSKLEGYILFPWLDSRGRPLTLYGRYQVKAAPEGKPKTIALKGEGTKQSPLYLDRAVKAGHKDIVMVEGVLDAALLQAQGDTRVCAYVAASCSGQQIETLERHRIESVTLCGDPDDGGENGTLSNVERISKTGIKVYVAPKLPDGLDPDEFLLREGLEGWDRHIASAVHGYTYKAQRILAKSDINTDFGRATVLEEAIAFTKTATDVESKLSLETFFWPTICEALGMSLEEVRKQLEDIYCKSDTRGAQANEKTDERLKLDLQSLLQESDPIKRMRRRSEIASHYRLKTSDIQEALKYLEQQTATPAKNWFTFDDFFNQESEALQWVVPQLLPRGETVLLAAQAKCGKTALATDIMYGVLSGGTVIGEQVGVKGKVLLISSDESSGSTRRRMRLRGFDLLDERSNFRLMRHLDITNLAELEAKLEDFRPDLVVIDSLTTICSEVGISEKDPEYARYIYKLKTVLGRYNSACILTHHENKDPLAKGINQVSGSARIPAAVWGILQLKAVDPNNDADPRRFLKIKPREGEATTLNLEINPKDTWLQDGIWTCHGEVDDTTGEKKTQGDRVLDLLRQYSPKGLTYQEIDFSLKIGRSLYQVLDRLEDRQLVTKRRSEFNSRQWVYAVPQQGGDTPPPSVDQTGVVESPESVTNTDFQQFNNQFNNYSTPIQQPDEFNGVLNSQNLDSASDSTSIQQPDDQKGGEGVLNSTTKVLNPADESAPLLTEQIELNLSAVQFVSNTKSGTAFNPLPAGNLNAEQEIKNGVDDLPGLPGDANSRKEDIAVVVVTPQPHQLASALAPQPNSTQTQESAAAAKVPQDSQLIDKAVTPQLGDTVRIPNGHLGVVEIIYPSGEMGVVFDNGRIFTMYKPSVLSVISLDKEITSPQQTPALATTEFKVGDAVAHADQYTVAYIYHGIVEKMVGDNILVRWAERTGKPFECERYDTSELRRLE